MKILVDMNLSPLWVQALENHGFTAIHWSSVGDGSAPDSEVMKWAHDNDYVVFTNDLDFGAIRAVTKARRRALFRYARRTSLRST